MKVHYIYSDRKRYYVEKEVYTAINQITNHIHYIRSNADQCRSNRRQRSMCEGDCNQCPGYANQEETLDNIRTLPGSRESTLEDIVACNEILDAMQEVDPDGRRIGQLYLGGCRDADIAQILDVSTSAFYRRKRKIKAHLREII